MSIRNGSRAIIAHELEELQTAKDDHDSIGMILNNISEVLDSLKAIEKILSQTEFERIPEEMTEQRRTRISLNRSFRNLRKILFSQTQTIKPLTSQVCRRLQSPLMTENL